MFYISYNSYSKYVLLVSIFKYIQVSVDLLKLLSLCFMFLCLVNNSKIMIPTVSQRY